MIKDEKMYQEILNNEITANYENLIGLIKRCINIKIALGLKAELNYDSNNLLNYGLLYGNIIDRLSNSKLSYGRMIATGSNDELYEKVPMYREIVDLQHLEGGED